VLVLEQHDQAGGCCHTFIDKGYEFDTGIHYVGEMAEGTSTRVLVDQLTMGKLDWTKLEDTFDTVVLGSGDHKREFPVPSGKGAWEKSLCERFPGEEKGIGKYFELVREVAQSAGVLLGVMKLAPRWFSRLLVWSGLLKRWFPVEVLGRSLQEVLDSHFSDPDLKAVLAYAFGDYGTAPKEASFLMHAILTRHFMYGAYYPRGGASEIAFQIIPTIERAGGRVLVRAPVREILLNDARDQVVGVQVKKGHNVFDILAPIVISDAGLTNTARTLLPEELGKGCGLVAMVDKLRPGMALMTVFIGLDGSAEELGLKASNVWAFSDSDLQTQLDNYMSLAPDEATKLAPPLLFISFPSTKDPTFAERFPGKSTCEIVTVSPHRWYKEWEKERVMHRGEDYQSLKLAIGRQAWGQVLEMFPHLEGREEYFDVGTSLSNQYYLGSYGGEVYGVDHNLERFTLDTMAKLRPQTGLAGLYLTGQDVMACGFSGAMYGGVFCASAILRRNLVTELAGVRKELRDLKKKM
jgi:all-trans-retinol 13,14-reductase